MKVSIVIGVLDEAARLPRVIDSIRGQRYPQHLIEIVVADGGSTDGTQDYARARGCVVVENPLRRCEPGIAIGYAAATGDVVTIMAADNVLHTPDFIESIVQPFADPNVYAAVPRVVSTSEDCTSTRYINDFTDPFNHFVYGSAATPRTFSGAYSIRQATPSYTVYDFKTGSMPLIAMAQGTTLRAKLARRPGTEEDDVQPILDIIEEGHEIAYVPDATIEHHTVKNMADLLAKFGPRISTRLREKDQPVWQRSLRWTTAMRMRAYLWPFYAISFVIPLLVGVFSAVRDRRAIWLFHPAINFCLGIEFWRRVLVHILFTEPRRAKA